MTTRRTLTLIVERDDDRFPGYTDREIITLVSELLTDRIGHLDPLILAAPAVAERAS